MRSRKRRDLSSEYTIFNLFSVQGKSSPFVSKVDYLVKEIN